MKLATRSLAMFGLLAAATLPAFADTAHHPGTSSGKSATTPAATPQSEGTIKKVDKAAGKLTIAHGPLRNLDMPGMTMVFKVKDPAILEQLKSGDRIRFTADKVDGAFTVTQLEVAN